MQKNMMEQVGQKLPYWFNILLEEMVWEDAGTQTAAVIFGGYKTFPSPPPYSVAYRRI
jgi:hypothetical protein